MTKGIGAGLGLAAILCVASPAYPHTIRPAVATVVIKESGEFNLQIRVNAEVLLADIGPEYTDTNTAPNAAVYDRLRSLEPAALEEQFASFAPRLLQAAMLQVDGVPLQLEFIGLTVPPVGDIELSRDSLIQLAGQIRPDSHALVWKWPAEFGSSVVRFSREGSNDPPQSHWLQPGQVSPVFQLGNTTAMTSRFDVVLNYVVIGFEHIVPKGLDHILFVVGLFLFSFHLKPLLMQVTAFTVAHTITLGLSIYGVFSLPASIVEPLIALSIAYVGCENCMSSSLKASRLALVFAFGLLHGLGFAGVLTEIGLPKSEFLTALLSFNVGVEFGQLAVILACLILVGWCRSRPWYRQVIVIPGSALIALIGLYWTWQRIVG